jgi:hypothetical protein
MKTKIEEQYNYLVQLNNDNLEKKNLLLSKYKEEVEKYENLQSQVIKEEIESLVLSVKEIFPQYDVEPTKFGFKLSSTKGIYEEFGEKKADDENSGLGDYFHGQDIYKTMTGKLGHIIKTVGEDIAWFDPLKDSKYDYKTSWVYTYIEYHLKKSYINKVYNFKTAPQSKI